jgi:NDP-sugar pyrophosphorylase family protein
MPNVSMPDAIILCGGAGLRLRSVTGAVPKPMASVAGRPFLELLLRQLSRHGFQRAILAVGYQKEFISSSLSKGAFGLHLTYAAEEFPLGTGGAARNAADLCGTETILIMNGDSYTDMALSNFVEVHCGSKAELSLVVVPGDGRGDVGSVEFDEYGELTRFSEKKSGADSKYYINAGIYMVSKGLLNESPAGIELSLERELIPRWIQSKKDVHAFVHEGSCVDIGTPDRYLIAQRTLARAEVVSSDFLTNEET